MSDANADDACREERLGVTYQLELSRTPTLMRTSRYPQPPVGGAPHDGLVLAVTRRPIRQMGNPGGLSMNMFHER